MAKPIYDMSKTFEDNVNNGPDFSGEIPKRILPPKELWHTFLDYKIASRIGVPSCGVAKNEHAVLLAKLGFDVITYKTIRAHERVAHPVPNLCRIDCTRTLTYADVGTQIKACADSGTMHDLAAACSLGNPSFDPEKTQQDIQYIRTSMVDGQVLIVSVYGEGKTLQEVGHDYARAACLAVESGAQVVELNVSCPNIIGGKFLYLDPQAIGIIVAEVAKVVRTIPILIKVGIFDDITTMRDVLRAGVKAGMRGVCGINSVKMKVVNAEGAPTFGKRILAGVSGSPVRNLALQTIRDIQSVNTQERLGLTVLGTGGVVLSEHFDDFFAAGADVAMSATGTIWNPYLAHEYHKNNAAHYVQKSENIKEL